MYIWVSSIEQNESRQFIAAQGLKIPAAQIYMDKQSGKNTARPGLRKLLATVKWGDTIVVESVSRFARNTKIFPWESIFRFSRNIM
ncbi:MAG: recombinase family protein [Oscillospiraceae bacterium]|nr:recombinase family protein [Oscillospiraceae bacterium]